MIKETTYNDLTIDDLRAFKQTRFHTQLKKIMSVLQAVRRFSEDILEEFEEYNDWETLSETQDLSEEFIRKYSEKVDWWYISVSQDLSEDFICEFHEKVVFYDSSIIIASIRKPTIIFQ